MKTTENDEDHPMEFLGGNQSTLATPAAAARSFRTVEAKTHVRMLPNILRGEPPRGGGRGRRPGRAAGGFHRGTAVGSGSRLAERFSTRTPLDQCLCIGSLSDRYFVSRGCHASAYTTGGEQNGFFRNCIYLLLVYIYIYIWLTCGAPIFIKNFYKFLY
jgi:hypothetical protein